MNERNINKGEVHVNLHTKPLVKTKKKKTKKIEYRIIDIIKIKLLLQLIPIIIMFQRCGNFIGRILKRILEKREEINHGKIFRNS